MVPGIKSLATLLKSLIIRVRISIKALGKVFLMEIDTQC